MVEKVKSRSELKMFIQFEVSEEEARALKAIVGYGTKAFLETFYKHMGRHYLEPYEGGVHSLFETIKKELPRHLEKADTARKALSNQ